MESYKAAVVQMNSQPDVHLNLNEAGKLIEQAVATGAKLVALPENFAFLGSLEKRMEQADKISQAAESFLLNAARQHNIFLLGGSFPVPANNGKVYNRSLLINPKGEVIAQYDKIHLFDVDLEEGESYRESDYVEPGKGETVVYDSEEIGNLGLSVCYDLRFPELYSRLSTAGAHIFSVPSAFTKTTGKVHWEILLRARAIENTCYVLAPAQTGTHGPSRKTYGHSMIVDPWGIVIAEAGLDTGIITAQINPERLEHVRASIPSLRHKRL